MFLAGQKLTGGQLNQLAEDALLTGIEMVSFASGAGTSVDVDFGQTLAAVPSRVDATISSGAGVAAGWTVRTDSYTTTGFRLILSTSGSAQAWTDVPIIWQAFGSASLSGTATPESGISPVAYTPLLTATTTTPTLGTGSTSTGWYYRNGLLITGEARLQFGSASVSAGSGTYRISLPVPPNTTYHAASGAWGVASSLGGGALRDNSTSNANWKTCELYFSDSSSGGRVSMFVNGSGNVTEAVPWTWAASDAISIRFAYVAAS